MLSINEEEDLSESNVPPINQAFENQPRNVHYDCSATMMQQHIDSLVLPQPANIPKSNCHQRSFLAELFDSSRIDTEPPNLAYIRTFTNM